MLRKPRVAAVGLLSSFALVAGTSAAVASPGTESQPSTDSTTPSPRASGVIVKYAKGEVRMADLAATVDEQLPGKAEVAGTRSGSKGLGLIEFDRSVKESNLDSAIESLNQDPDVEWAVPNGRRYAAATANDPFYTSGKLWNLTGTWGVQANDAWDVTTGVPSVRVAVLDTGIRKDHPDLAANLVAGYDFVDDEYTCSGIGDCWYDRTFLSAGDGNGWDADPSDPGDWVSANYCGYSHPGANSSWHGTHVAGTVAAIRNNGTGVVGVAPGVKTQPIRVLGKCGGTDWDIAMGMLWAAGEDIYKYDASYGRLPVNPTPAKVLNLSLGGTYEDLSDAQEMCEFYDAVSQIVMQRGATIVAAAGNDGDQANYTVPGSCPGFISVAATTTTGAKAVYSNYGPTVDVAAPGGSSGDADADGISDYVLSTYNLGTTTPGPNGYAEMAGTSMATPAVAGTVALAYSVGITDPVVIERVLKATARRSSCPESQCGAGVVSAKNLLAAKVPTGAPVISGVPQVGQTLRASTGTWRNNDAAINLTWYRDSTVVGTGATYLATAADVGANLFVRAQASGAADTVFVDTPVTVKYSSRVAISIPAKVKKSKRATLTVKVSAGYTPVGLVYAYDGKRRIASARLYASNRGVVKIKLPKLKKGTHKIKVVYGGSAQNAASTSAVKTVKSR